MPLLLDFARSLQGRGFRVAGLLQSAESAGYRLMALDGSGPERRVDTLESAMLAAAQSLRAAMRDDVDLVMLNNFPGFCSAARLMRSSFQAGTCQGMPVLTSITGDNLAHWLELTGQRGTILTPTAPSLWHWWGAERLYADLAQGVARDEVRALVCGPRWLMVQGPLGTGLAYLPRPPRDLPERLNSLKQKSLRDLAELTRSWDPLDMAVGMAAINAQYNRADLDSAPGNGADLFGQEAGRVVVVGAFPGLSDALPNPQVIEHEPRAGEYPTVAMDTLLPGCAAAVVAASSLVNRTLPRILRLAQGSRLALVGPAAPLSARLHDYGVEVMGGLVVRDPAGLAAAIHSGAPPRDFTRFAQYRHIRGTALPGSLAGQYAGGRGQNVLSSVCPG